MRSDNQLRLRVWRLIRLGMNQKVIASKMQMGESTFNRWLHQTTDRIANVHEEELFNEFIKEIRAEAETAHTLTDVDDLKTAIEAFKTEHHIGRTQSRARKQKRHARGKKLAPSK